KLQFESFSLLVSSSVVYYAAAHIPGHRILVAEDEEGVSRVIHKALSEAGYEVRHAKTGVEALELFRGEAPFDLILTDVVMPGRMQGPALVKAIRQTHPELPCIFMSGYAAETIISSDDLRASDQRLMKPIGRTDLLAAVASALKTPVDA
ncbi:MAG: response regulator, partial [Litoreibacter sp.]|nr:response regulator [Litoreibacter sp.]